MYCGKFFKESSHVASALLCGLSLSFTIESFVSSLLTLLEGRMCGEKNQGVDSALRDHLHLLAYLLLACGLSRLYPTLTWSSHNIELTLPTSDSLPNVHRMADVKVTSSAHLEKRPNFYWLARASLPLNL